MLDRLAASATLLSRKILSFFPEAVSIGFSLRRAWQPLLRQSRCAVPATCGLRRSLMARKRSNASLSSLESKSAASSISVNVLIKEKVSASSCVPKGNFPLVPRCNLTERGETTLPLLHTHRELYLTSASDVSALPVSPEASHTTGKMQLSASGPFSKIEMTGRRISENTSSRFAMGATIWSFISILGCSASKSAIRRMPE